MLRACGRYAILNIRNYRDEVVDLARHQGIYLPFMLDRRECSSSPLALAYIRGHYLGLVGEEREQAAGTTVLLPITSPDAQLLPVHFMSDLECGNESAIVREWFCCRHVDGVLCVEQHCPARTDRPLACQTLVNRYVEYLQTRFLQRTAARGGAAGGSVACADGGAGCASLANVKGCEVKEGGGSGDGGSVVSPIEGWTTFDQDGSII